MVDDDRDRVRETERTTIVTGGGRGGGGGTVLAVILVLILIVILLFVLFGGWLGSATDEISVPDEVSVNVNVDQPDVQMPDVEVPEAEPLASNEGGNTS